MYFFKKGGKQFLDLTGNLILSHNDQLVKSRVPSAAPTKILNAKFAVNISKLNFLLKIKTTWAVLRFVWGSSTALTPDDT